MGLKKAPQGRPPRLKAKMTSIADFKEEHQPPGWERLKASIRTRISVYIGIAAFVGWVISHISPKRRRTYAHGGDQDANHPSGETTLTSKSQQAKRGSGLLPLALELLGAVAIRLVQRYLKSWSSSLVLRLQNPPEPRLSSVSVLRKPALKASNNLSDHRSEILPKELDSEKPYQKRCNCVVQKHRE
jgi:hypothetical protein